MGKKSTQSPPKTSRYLVKLSEQLFEAETDRTTFLKCLDSPHPFAPTILWTKPKPATLSPELTPLEPLPWQPAFVDRLAIGTRPGQHPLHQAGYFYCLDGSSVFAASVLGAIAEPISSVLDLCAAPGGKGLYSWVTLKPKVLLCNEVVQKRVKILIANLKRCGANQAKVLNQDSAVLAEHLPQSLDLVLVDAPCSGQSLLAKGKKVPGCCHPVTLKRNANRQKRILANAAQMVRPGGYLAYMTCTYAPQENEQVCQWLLKTFPQFEPLVVPNLALYRSRLTELPCYRLLPQSGIGAGAFAMLLKNTESSQGQSLNEAFLERYGYILT
ncbi:MAG: RsmB/NOP family class I SAM-dependent RNA methyltransferase [Leptolyngbyaceae cyanobacterium]